MKTARRNNRYFNASEDFDAEKLRQCYVVAGRRSHDPNTQNGAVLVSYRGMVRYYSANAFPAKVKQTKKRLARPAKYSFIEHAERNAIYASAKDGAFTEWSTLYCPYAACAECARAIIQAGITRVVADQRLLDIAPDRWKDSIAIGDQMLREAGVRKDCLNVHLDAPTILFDGKPFSP